MSAAYVCRIPETETYMTRQQEAYGQIYQTDRQTKKRARPFRPGVGRPHQKPLTGAFRISLLTGEEGAGAILWQGHLSAGAYRILQLLQK